MKNIVVNVMISVMGFNLEGLEEALKNLKLKIKPSHNNSTNLMMILKK
jgi:hypothetical protein